MYQVLIDGDNVHCDIYLEEIYPMLIKKYKNFEKHYTTVVVQTNFIMRFESLRKMSVNIQCCQTKHKDATDARILMLAGMFVERGDDVIIVSNDNIYKEIDDVCNIVGYNIEKKRYKLNKKSLIKILDQKEESEDITIHDLQRFYYPMINKSEIINYIKGMDDIEISNNDSIYLKNRSRMKLPS